MWPTAQQPGFGVFVCNMAQGLEDCGNQMTAKAVKEGKGKNVASKMWGYFRLYLSAAAAYLKKSDFVYVHFPNQTTPLLRLLSAVAKRRVVVNYHGEDLLYQPHGLAGVLGRMTDRYVARHASAVVVPSAYFKGIVAGRGIPVHRIVVSPSGGINSQLFHSLKDCKDGGFTIGYVGRFDQGKGAWDYVKAFEKVTASMPARGVMIGYGEDFPAISDHVQSHQLDIQLIPGLAQSELPRMYASMNLFLFPTTRQAESLGLTGIEAMACGTPVVGSDIGGIPSYLHDGVNGYLAAPGGSDSFANAVLRYAALPANDKERMRQACLDTAAEYDSDKVARRLDRDLKNILANPAKG